VRVSAQDLARRVKTRVERKRRGLHGAVITEDDR